MEKIFDLQRFGALDLTSTSITLTTTGKPTSVVYVTAAGTAGVTKVEGATISLSGNLASGASSFNVSSIKSIAIDTKLTAGASIGGAGSYTITDTTSTTLDFKTTNTGTGTLTKGTISGGVLTKFEGLNAGGTFIFDTAVSGTVAGSAQDTSYTVANFKGVLDTDQNVTTFTAGTVKLANSVATGDKVTSIAGVLAVGGTYTPGKLSDGTEYINASLGGSSKKFDLTGATEAFNVIGTSGIDEITVATGGNHSVKAGNGGDTITLTGSDKAVYIMGENGNDIITATGSFAGNGSSIYGGAGNDTIDFVSAEAKELLVDGGDGNDTIVLTAGITYSTILGGAGKDTITSKDATNVVTGGADADFFVMTSDVAVNISDYVYGTDVLYLDKADVALSEANAAATADGALKSDGTSGFATLNGGNATITGSNGIFAVNLKDSSGGTVDLGWVGDSKATINGSAVNRSMVLTGMTNAEGDLLVGGAKSDTLYAGADDSVYGGAGKDNISIASGAAGVYVGIATNSGKDTVAGFTGGFDISANDAVYVVSGSASDLGAEVASDGTVTVTDGSASLELGAFSANSTTNAYELLLGTSKVAMAKNGEVIKTDDLSYADFWIGTYDSATKTGSGVDLRDVATVVNLNFGTATNVRNMTSVTGGSGVTTLIGGSAAEYLAAADGSTTMFFYGQNQGNDVINGSANDVVNLYGLNLADITSANIESSRVVFATTANDTVTVNGVQTFQLADGSKWTADYTTNTWKQAQEPNQCSRTVRSLDRLSG